MGAVIREKPEDTSAEETGMMPVASSAVTSDGTVSCTRANFSAGPPSWSLICTRSTLMSRMKVNSVFALDVNTYVLLTSAVTSTCEKEEYRRVLSNVLMCAIPMKKRSAYPPSMTVSTPPMARMSSSARVMMRSWYPVDTTVSIIEFERDMRAKLPCTKSRSVSRSVLVVFLGGVSRVKHEPCAAIAAPSRSSPSLRYVPKPSTVV